MKKTIKRRIILNNFDALWKFFASVRLTVVILISLALASTIGTVIPQRAANADYFQAYGEFLFNVFHVLDIFDMYHSWWFKLLMVILTVNIIICSIDRLSSTWKIIFPKNPSFNVSRFRDLSNKQDFTVSCLPEPLEKVYKQFVSKRFGYTRIEKADKGFCVFAEKGRWTRFGVYIVHISVIFLLLGALIGSYFGLEGYVNIPEGESVNQIRLRNNNQTHTLDFEIQCNDFNVSFYDTGAPKEFRSDLTIIENGKPVSNKSIIVNDPLRYKGINMFQSSYGMLPSNEVSLNFTSRETGMVYLKKAVIGQEFDIPEGMGKFMVEDFKSSFNFMGKMNIGETFIGTFTQSDGKTAEIAIPLQHPSFDEMRKGDFLVSVADYKKRYYTGLQVTKDPGVLIVYTGFIVMIAGIFICFFMSHERICVEVAEDGNKSMVTVAGTANKNKPGMDLKIARLSKSLARLETA
ncbi:MAG: cytochrome c biogenesis protein ResB [Desulfobacteraceae bacterium]|nr:cytochrome c biogenesis protein ResB [Desulfobacteraceae bacterium]